MQIADRGVRALVKVLDSNNVVTFLNLADNQVCFCCNNILLAVICVRYILYAAAV